MLSLNNDFLGYHPKEHNVRFSGTDTSKIFLENLKTQSNDWYYRSNTISYDRNSNGHRCKNIDEIDLNNYILFIGCSHTEGIGLKLEDTYPYLLSNKLECDYYNLGIAATGIDVLQYNLIIWFNKVKNPPKLLILQWPNSARFTLQNFPESPNIIPEPFYQRGSWSATAYKEIGEFLILAEHLNFFKTSYTLTKKIIHSISTCPVIEVNTNETTKNDVDLKFTHIDYARDVQKYNNSIHEYGHMGVESQKINTEILYQKIINTR